MQAEICFSCGTLIYRADERGGNLVRNAKDHTKHTCGRPLSTVYSELEPKPRVRLMGGRTHVHITRDGEALCGRSTWKWPALIETTKTVPTCPGCITKSLGAVKREAGVR